jgi:hypothetical protein
MIIAKEAGKAAETDAEGNFLFSGLTPGQHTFQVMLSGKKAREIKATIPGQSYDFEI